MSEDGGGECRNVFKLLNAENILNNGLENDGSGRLQNMGQRLLEERRVFISYATVLLFGILLCVCITSSIKILT